MAKPVLESESQTRRGFTRRHALGLALAGLGVLLALAHDRVLDVCSSSAACKLDVGVAVGIAVPALLVVGVWLFVAATRPKERSR